MFEDLEFRERAYELWEKVGRPERSEQLYWRLAQEQLEAEAPAVAGAECNTVIELKPEHHAA